MIYRHIKKRLDWHVWNIRTHGWFHRPSIADSHEIVNGELLPYYVYPAIFLLAVSAALLHWWPDLLPFGLTRVWQMHGTLTEWLWTGKWVLLWGVGVTALMSVLTRNKPEENRQAEQLFVYGLFVSVRAGLLEELCFRWAHFMFYAILAQGVDIVLGGFFYGHGLVWFVQEYFMAPVANFATLHYLSDWLMNPAIWYVGAGLIWANSHFRDGHKYLGLLGYVNSWFIGMFFFYMTLNYGIVSAMVVHGLYDALIHLVRYIDEITERAEGNV